MIQLSVAFGILGLVAVAASLLYFATTADSERGKICDIVEAAMYRQAEALIAAVPIGDNATQEQLDARARTERVYLEGIAKSFEECQ